MKIKYSIDIVHALIKECDQYLMNSMKELSEYVLSTFKVYFKISSFSLKYISSTFQELCQ